MYATFCSITDSEKKVGKKWVQAGFEPVHALDIAWKSQSHRSLTSVLGIRKRVHSHVYDHCVNAMVRLAHVGRMMPPFHTVELACPLSYVLFLIHSCH